MIGAGLDDIRIYGFERVPIEWYDQREIDRQPQQLNLVLEDTRELHRLSPSRKVNFDPKTNQDMYELIQQRRMLTV